ncbi:hypothetical protein NT6N_33050 [Oceaniferula spumae]|uniref:Uncharacterized protein n=1 Tax=Oceaniferula spumae TaxID=2979115 RepID=A0AAT9FQH4_9BACT
MTDRLLVFSNPEVQKLLKEKFIPVAGNDWYQRRRQDAEGEFFRNMASQGPRKGEGGSTRQGHYVFTSGGKLLGYNNNRGAERRLAMIHDALKKWEALPDAEKKAEVPDRGKVDAKFTRNLPEGGRIINVYIRALEKRNGKAMAMTGEKVGRLAAVDHLWLRASEEAELHRLVKAGGGELPAWFTHRILRYHLVDSTRGEPPLWKFSEVKTNQISIDAKGKVHGAFGMRTEDQKRGYAGALHGRISFNSDGKLASVELLANGQHWGEGRYTKGARPGKTHLAVYLELSDGSNPADRIPPQGMHWERAYWNAQKGM